MSQPARPEPDPQPEDRPGTSRQPTRTPPPWPIPSRHPSSLGPGETLRPIVQFSGGGIAWARGARAMLGVGLPFAAVTGWLGLAQGVSAALGGYTVLYAAREPYGYRARVLGLVGVGLAAALGAGTAAAGEAWLSVGVITVIATLATFLCGALRIDRPGGYMFTLVCAIGTFLPYDPSGIAERVALLLLGAAGAWLVSMSGWLVRPHHPEHAALADGYRAVAAFVDAIGRGPTDATRHQASRAVYHAWEVVSRSSSDGPYPGARRGRVRRLRLLSRRMLDLFLAAELLDEERAEPLPEAVAQSVARIADAVDHPNSPTVSSVLDDVHTAAQRHLRAALRAAVAAAGEPDPAKGEGIPGRRPTPGTRLRTATDRSSVLPPLALRTGLAVGAATALGHLLPVLHPSWVAIAAAAALQGGNAALDLGRVLQRAVGTFLGVTVVAAFLHDLEPGTWAVVTSVALLFGAAQSVIVRNLVLGVALVTPVGLLLAGSGVPGAHVGDLASARLLDTLIGLALGLLASFLLWGRASANRLPAALARCIRTEGALLHEVVGPHFPAEPVWARTRQAARRDLLDLWTVYDGSLGEVSVARGGLRLPLRHAGTPERLWPALVVVQRLGYRLMAVPLRRTGGGYRRPQPLTAGEVAELDAYVAELADAAEQSRRPAPPALPDLWGYPAIRQYLKRLRTVLTEAVPGQPQPADTGAGPERVTDGPGAADAVASPRPPLPPSDEPQASGPGPDPGRDTGESP